MNTLSQTQIKTASKPFFTLVSSSLLQRKCACGGSPGLDGECEECRSKRLQRRSANNVEPNTVPPIVHEVLRLPGHPFDPQTRVFFEPRFGHDFSKVRVHTDARAAESAKAVNALAYTVGRNVVFDEGRFSPETHAGQRLLAHELTHVVQQEHNSVADASAIGPLNGVAEIEAEESAQAVNNDQAFRKIHAPANNLQRQGADETRVEFLAAGSCSMEQGNILTQAIEMALEWLNTAIRQLNEYILLPPSPEVQNVEQSLDNHFHTHSFFHADLIRDRLIEIQNNVTSRRDFTSECAPETDQTCQAGASAYVTDDLGGVRWCPSFFGGYSYPTWQAQTVIHESAHVFAPKVDRPGFVTDRAYFSERIYAHLRPEEAMDNADSYANLVQDLGTGRLLPRRPPSRPSDPSQSCSPEASEMVRRALARAEMWNRIAYQTLVDTKPESIARHAPLRLRYFGTDDSARIPEILNTYRRVSERLHSNIQFQCEPAGGTCTGSSFGWWTPPDILHLCPSLAGLDENPRIKALYAAILLYYATDTTVPVGDLYKYIDLAEAITEHYRPTPPPLPSEPFPISPALGTATP